MVGDYISTSFLAGQQRVVAAIAIGLAPADGLFNEPMFAGLEKLRSGVNRTGDDSVLFRGLDADLSESPPTTF